MRKSIPISIFGSCVSRDSFEAKSKYGTIFDIKSYIARQTVISSLEAPIAIKEQDIALESPFQRRMVLSDMKKDAFSRLKSDGSRFLMIDFVDERVGIVEMCGSVASYSTELGRSGLLDRFEHSPPLKPKFENGGFWVKGRDLEKYCTEFFCKLLKI